MDPLRIIVATANNSLKSDTVSGLWPATAPLSSNVRHNNKSRSNHILKLKDDKSMAQVADELLQNYLTRCYSAISKQYTPIAGMKPEDGVRRLFELRNAGKINISLHSVGELIECEISTIS